MVYAKRDMEFEETREFFDEVMKLKMNSLNRDQFVESIRQLTNGARFDLSIQLPSDSIVAKDFLVDRGFKRVGV